jgi:hypothetical protein
MFLAINSEVRLLSFSHHVWVFLAAHQPEHNTESECGTRERCDIGRLGLIKMQNNEFPDEGGQGNEDDGPGLNDIALAVKDDHERVFELEGNQQCQDHSEQRLERLRVPWIEQVAPYHAHGMKNQLPGGDGHDHGNDPGQDGDDQLLELLIDRERLPARVPR